MLKINQMCSNHTHKIRFQDDVYFKSDKSVTNFPYQRKVKCIKSPISRAKEK